MTAREIMNRDSMWQTLERAAYDCDDAIYRATDSADWRESKVSFANTLGPEDIMEEAME